jgi:hypothetical protein
MAKEQPTVVGSMLTIQDIMGWYQDNPLPASKADASFPVVVNSKSQTWRTMSNMSLPQNEAADPISLNSSVPVAGREGFKDVTGDMTSFGKGREMNADQIEKFEELKIKFLELKNPASAQDLINYYGADLAFVRTAMEAEKSYLDWALVSNACNIQFVAANSPYMTGLATMDYGLETWQKDNVGTSWSNIAAEILDDVESVLDTADVYGKTYVVMFINKTWFTHVRKNTQIQKYCATLVQNLYNTQSPPTLEAVNAMMTEYFNMDIRFEVISEKVTRTSKSNVKTTAVPFADGVAVFAASTILGHFEWNPIPITDTTKETYESFFLVGNVKKVDPSYSKIYAKGRGFPVIDTYSDNFYLRINATPWE